VKSKTTKFAKEKIYNDENCGKRGREKLNDDQVCENDSITTTIIYNKHI